MMRIVTTIPCREVDVVYDKDLAYTFSISISLHCGIGLYSSMVVVFLEISADGYFQSLIIDNHIDAFAEVLWVTYIGEIIEHLPRAVDRVMGKYQASQA